jgi:hypothetical protein
MVWNDVGVVLEQQLNFNGTSIHTKELNDLMNHDFLKIPIPDFLLNYFRELIMLFNKNGYAVPHISKEQNFLKVSIAKENCCAIILFYYKNEGFVTTVYPSKTNSKDFLDDLKEVIFQMKAS